MAPIYRNPFESSEKKRKEETLSSPAATGRKPLTTTSPADLSLGYRLRQIH